MYSELAVAALGVVDKALEMGLIKMKEKYKKDYFTLRKSLNEERLKQKKDRDYGRIKRLEEDIQLLLNIFRAEIEGKRGE